jgi:hypothetical protein
MKNIITIQHTQPVQHTNGIVSHGMALETWYALWLKWGIDMFERSDFMNSAGGVSFMRENDDGKRILMRLNDMSYSGREVRLV